MRTRTRGFALITVLWIAMLMGLFVAGLVQSVDRGQGGLSGVRDRLAAEIMMERDLERTIWVLKNGGLRGNRVATTRADGLIRREILPEGRVAVRVSLADGLVDLNAADDPVLSDLARYLSKLADAADDREDIRDALLDLRGSHTSVQSLGALADQIGMTRAQFLTAASVMTVASGRPAPDLARSPATLLREVVGINASTLDGLLEARRTRGVQSMRSFSYPGADRELEIAPRGPVWHITVAARVNDAVALARTWVIFLPLPEERAAAPYFVLESWPVSPEDAVFEALDAPLTDEEADSP